MQGLRKSHPSNRGDQYELGNPEGHRPAFRLRNHDVRRQPL